MFKDVPQTRGVLVATIGQHATATYPHALPFVVLGTINSCRKRGNCTGPSRCMLIFALILATSGNRESSGHHVVGPPCDGLERLGDVLDCRVAFWNYFGTRITAA